MYIWLFVQNFAVVLVLTLKFLKLENIYLLSLPKTMKLLPYVRMTNRRRMTKWSRAHSD